MTTDPPDVGSDVAKDQLDVAVPPSGEPWRVAHDRAGLAQVAVRLDALAPALIVLEASGGSARPGLAALTSAGLPVAVVNPRPPRAVARATGTLATTDRLDAAALARFARARQPPARPAPAAAAQVLAATLARRRHLRELLTAAQHRVRTAIPAVRPHGQAHSAWLQAALGDRDRDLARQIRDDPTWRERAEVRRSAPGVGRVLAGTLLADLPEVGQLTRRQSAAVVGVAPLTDDRGTRRGKRTTWGGARRCAAPCPWLPSWPPATTRSSVPAPSACWPPASPSRWRWGPGCARC
jgi:transposase